MKILDSLPLDLRSTNHLNMKKVILIAGSNSSKSINKQLVKYAGSLMESAQVEYVSLEDFEPPIFSTDLELEIGTHPKIKALLDKFSKADGVIISTPEHNSMPTAFFKNILDWLSRTSKLVLDGKGYLEGKHVIVLSTSPGGGAAKGALALVTKNIGYSKATLVGEFSLPKFNDHFEDGKITTIQYANELKSLVSKFEATLDVKS